MSGEAGEELDTPAARIMARRESRAAMPDRLKVAAPDDSSDEEWNGDDDEDEEEDGRVYLDASKCGRVRLHAVQGPAQSSSGLGVDDERRKSLADKGWARRTAVGGERVRAGGLTLTHLRGSSDYRSCQHLAQRSVKGRHSNFDTYYRSYLLFPTMRQRTTRCRRENDESGTIAR